MKNLWNRWKLMVDKHNENNENNLEYTSIFKPLIYGIIFSVISFLFTFEFTIFLITLVSITFVMSLIYFINWNSECPC